MATRNLPFTPDQLDYLAAALFGLTWRALPLRGTGARRPRVRHTVVHCPLVEAQEVIRLYGFYGIPVRVASGHHAVPNIIALQVS